MENHEIILENMRNRRSIRKWTKQPVERWKIDKILEAGVYAPSGANTQKTYFHVITDLEKIKFVSQHSSQWFYRIFPTVIILVLFDLKKPTPMNLNVTEPHFAWKRLIWQDTAAATENMLLMAEALGLGACWVSILPPELGPLETAIREFLDIGSRYILCNMVFVGYPGQKINLDAAFHEGSAVKKNPVDFVLETVNDEK